MQGSPGSTAPVDPVSQDAAAADRRLVLVRATREESRGASLRLAGLTVAERSLRQLAALQARVVIASDGSCPLPNHLPDPIEVRTISGTEGLAALRAQLPGAVEVALDEVRPVSRDFGHSLRITDRESCRRAEDAVFAELLRGDLGIVARYLNKPVSFRITRYLLCHLPVSPNQVTVAAALIGLMGAGLVATGSHWLMVLGLLLAHVQSVLDGCDGELARVRFQQSSIGEWLDTLVDEGLNIALFASIGIGLWRATGSTLALAAGLAASGIHVFYDVVALTELVRQGRGGELMRIRWHITGGIDMKNRTGKRRGDPVVLVHGLSRRDFFIFVFAVYAILGVPFMALVHASCIAVGQLMLSSSQLVWRLSQCRSRH